MVESLFVLGSRSEFEVASEFGFGSRWVINTPTIMFGERLVMACAILEAQRWVGIAGSEQSRCVVSIMRVVGLFVMVFFLVCVSYLMMRSSMAPLSTLKNWTNECIIVSIVSVTKLHKRSPKPLKQVFYGVFSQKNDAVFFHN